MIIKERDGKNYVAKQEFFSKLFNEVPGKEIETKLAFFEKIDPISLLESCKDYFNNGHAKTCPFIPHVLIAINHIDKYQDPKGHVFSVLQREDGTTAIKRKGKKNDIGGIMINEEQKVEVENKKDSKKTVCDFFNIPPNKLKYIGSLERQRHRIALKNASGRVYVLVIDNTRIVDINNNPTLSKDNNLQQMEIEYKGIIDQVEKTNQKDVDNLISNELTDIRNELINFLSIKGVSIISTTKTKTQWLLESNTTS